MTVFPPGARILARHTLKIPLETPHEGVKYEAVLEAGIHALAIEGDDCVSGVPEDECAARHVVREALYGDETTGRIGKVVPAEAIDADQLN